MYTIITFILCVFKNKKLGSVFEWQYFGFLKAEIRGEDENDNLLFLKIVFEFFFRFLGPNKNNNGNRKTEK